MPLAIFLALALGATAAPELRMRGGAEVPTGEIMGVDLDGLSIKDDATQTRLSWDLVAEVRGEHAKAAEAFKDIADTSWRARSRADRGDFVAAEPLFEELYTKFAGRTGPTASLVSEGLLRCRLRRGVQTGAVSPWLAWLEAAEDGRPVARIEYVIPPGAPPLVDATTGLCPSVPPIWLKLPAVEALARGDMLPRRSEPPENTKPTRAQQLERLYRLSAAFETGFAPAVTQAEVSLRSPDAAIAIVSQIVAARAGDAGLRREARQLLQERLKQRQPQWLEAWIRMGIGRSLLREENREDRLLGAAQMLHVPARLRGASPYLAGVALAESAILEAELGAGAQAWALKRELQDDYSGHPAQDYEALRAIRAAAPGASRKKEEPTMHDAAPKDAAPKEAK